jgi:hypothetical protein
MLYPEKFPRTEGTRMTDFQFGKVIGHGKSNVKYTGPGNSPMKVGFGSTEGNGTLNVDIKDTTMPETPEQIEAANSSQRLNLILSFVFGVLFLSTILALLVFIPNPTKDQMRVFMVVLALAAGGFGTVFSGMLNVKLTLGKKLAIGATGALAVFVIVYFFAPAASQ